MSCHEKFLTKKDNHTVVNVTISDSVTNYPRGTLQADDGFLFCSICIIVMDHTRKHKIDKHLESTAHVRKAQNATGKQHTLKTAFECKT